MKKIFFTQRVDCVTTYGERRDAADQKIAEFLFACGFLPIPVPNSVSIAEGMCNEISPNGVFLSGGNSLWKYGGDAPERDVTERYLVDFSVKNNIPILGICRGCQFIADYFGTEIEPIEHHVKTFHSIEGIVQRKRTNSFHCFGIRQLLPPLIALGISSDGTVEAFRHETLPIMALMWHPERILPFDQEDIKMVRDFYESYHFSCWSRKSHER